MIRLQLVKEKNNQLGASKIWSKEISRATNNEINSISENKIRTKKYFTFHISKNSIFDQNNTYLKLLSLKKGVKWYYYRFDQNNW